MTAVEYSIKITLPLYFRVCGLIVNQEDMPFTDLVGTLIKNCFFSAAISAFISFTNNCLFLSPIKQGICPDIVSTSFH